MGSVLGDCCTGAAKCPSGLAQQVSLPRLKVESYISVLRRDERYLDRTLLPECRPPAPGQPYNQLPLSKNQKKNDIYTTTVSCAVIIPAHEVVKCGQCLKSEMTLICAGCQLRFKA